MAMRIVPGTGEVTSIAVIDPAKKYGQPGQYVTHTGTISEMVRITEEAKRVRKEVRWYYKGLTTSDEELVASQMILTWIPPGHVQPFHTHHTVHEYTIVMEGEIVAIDSDSLSEEECVAMSLFDLCRRGAKVVNTNCMVIEGPGVKHTVANKSDYYALMVTIQTARMPLDQFPGDWHRDKPST